MNPNQKPNEGKKGVRIDFTGLSLKQRISIWWDFTLSCLFKHNTETKYKVKSIEVVDDILERIK